jgi:DNA-binding transcriptional LysR family regulator
MDIRQLKLFVCVAERLNFTEAAKCLYLTQSTVSLRISEIEKQLDVKLFTRNTHGVKLTPAGETFLKEAKAIIVSYEEAIKLTRETAAGFSGIVKIGFLESHTKHFLPKAMLNFRTNYPNINLKVIQLPWHELSRGLERGDLDIGLTMPQSVGTVRQSYLENHLCRCRVLGYASGPSFGANAVWGRSRRGPSAIYCAAPGCRTIPL